MSEELVNQLQVRTMFTIPIFGGIEITETIVVTWIAMGIIIVFSLLATRHLSVEDPSRGQLILESVISKFDGFFSRLVGKKGKQYVPYFLFLFFFITTINLLPVFGFKPPAKDINLTASMAIITIVLVQVAGIREKKVGGWLKSFSEPVAMITPMNILELFTKPFSLCMRLMGNMFGGFAIMQLIEYSMPAVVPAFASLYFDFFDGILQAFVFSFLTALYVQGAIGQAE